MIDRKPDPLDNVEVKLYPRCMDLDQRQPPAYSAAGWLLPCCWADTKDWPGFEKLLQDHLKVENVDSIEDILFSDEWDEFYHNLVEHPVKAPPVCKKKCCTEIPFKRFLIDGKDKRDVTNRK